MNYELFIAKRIIAGKEYKNSISSPIIKIAIVAIALGIVIMLIAVAIASGFQLKIRDKIAGFKGHIQITNYDNNNSDVSTVPIDINQDFYPEFKTIDGIKNVQVFANKAGIIRTDTDFEGVVLKGVDEAYDFSFFNEYLVEGRLPNFNQERNREIIISKSVANRLQLHLNDSIQVWFSAENSKVPFKRRKPIVVGIFKTGFEQFDNTIVLGDIREVQRLNGWTENQVGGFEVLIDDFDTLKQKGNEIYSNIGATLNSTTITDQYPAIFEWIKLFDNNVWFIIAIMILIAGINMITALLVLILERVQMVGILKALGSQNWSIQKIFLYNAGYLILQGLFWGNLIGIALLLIQHFFKVITLNPETYYVSTVPVNFNIFHILLLNVGTLILCLIMLIIPSMIIAKIHPSKSIKFA
ncbi:ABC transporter permease [Tenacibaculum sp. IB213877]|uniref:ABC transporter permease n=1 Tax=Tenacibaculum sp. IB213877 TaxID=3097351 RepID=UPI002A5A6486|nr:FtsX-like permease family protein [Tenacibaculum sp. IB213877]MDY0779306.1 ABC transporter permease [Tenacibaculum sp. IB213877]